MKVTQFTKNALAVRRERRSLSAQGYKQHETDWQIVRGMATDHTITDVRISVCGKYVWTKTGQRPKVSGGVV